MTESAEWMRSARSASRACTARPPMHGHQSCPDRGNRSGARSSAQGGRWGCLAVSAWRASPKRPRACRFGRHVNGRAEVLASAEARTRRRTPSSKLTTGFYHRSQVGRREESPPGEARSFVALSLEEHGRGRTKVLRATRLPNRWVMALDELARYGRISRREYPRDGHTEVYTIKSSESDGARSDVNVGLYAGTVACHLREVPPLLEDP